MARRSKNQSQTNETQTNESQNTKEEATVTETVNPEATEAPAENAEKAEKKEPEFDLTEFKAAVDAAMNEADTDTGTVPEASLAAVTAAYRQVDGIKGKNAAKRHVNDLMKDLMNSGNLAGARSALQISDEALVATSASGGARAERTPVDPTDAAVQRVGTLRLALDNVVLPEGVSDDYEERLSKFVTDNSEAVGTYLEWIQADEEERGDEPEVPQFVKNAAKLAIGRSARAGAARTGGGQPYTGERRNIASHILNAFADKEEGEFLTVAEIRNVRSEEYGDSMPSAGAISVRLFPKDRDGNPTESTMLKYGIRPDTQGGKKGAVKDSSVIPADTDE